MIMWYPDTFLESLYAKYTKKRTAIEETKEQKKTRLQQKLVECLGRFDPPANGLQPKVIERVEDEDIIRERVEYSTGDGLRVPAYVLIPKSIGEGERRQIGRASCRERVESKDV